MDDIEEILVNGINFKKASGQHPADDKVKTKAKKKKYITGAHGSGSARQKAKYREISIAPSFDSCLTIVRQLFYDCAAAVERLCGNCRTMVCFTK